MTNKCQDGDSGGSAAREGGRDAWGGRGASFVIVRHLNKCTCWFATDGASPDSEKRAAKFKRDLCSLKENELRFYNKTRLWQPRTRLRRRTV